jgi:uncharacterized protein YjiS (DUF1127 family)
MVMKRDGVAKLGEHAAGGRREALVELDPLIAPVRVARLRSALVGRLLQRVARWARGAAAPVRESRARASLRRELMGKDDRLLRDMGILRADIPAVAGLERRRSAANDSEGPGAAA